VVDRFTAVARRYEVPDVLVAMTVVAVGTSLPEIGTGVSASLGILAGSLDYGTASATVLGGNMGSSTVQQLLLLGVLSIAGGRFALSRRFVRGVYLPMVAAFVLVLAVTVDGTVSRVDGVGLLAAYLGYVGYSLRTRPRGGRIPEAASGGVVRDAAVGTGGLVAVLGAAFVVLGVVGAVVDDLALGGSMVGVVTVGVAAALPELTAVVESVRRNAPDLALGTLVGSNVVNSLVGIGLGGAVSTYAVPPVVVAWDLPFKTLAAVGLLASLRLSDGELRRRQGAALVVLYFAFVAGRLLLFAGQ
jgi:cation:H+ antiporter